MANRPGDAVNSAGRIGEFAADAKVAVLADIGIGNEERKFSSIRPEKKPDIPNLQNVLGSRKNSAWVSRKRRLRPRR